MKLRAVLLLAIAATFSLSSIAADAPRPRAREAGIVIGTMSPGPNNAITDVAGVAVGHATLKQGTRFNTGVTAIVPHAGNIYRQRVPAAIEVGNGYGKLAGITQVRELGEIETPILLTGTLSTWKVADATVEYLLRQPGMENIRSINPVVGETNDGYLSDIRARPLTQALVEEALTHLSNTAVPEGTIGAGAGTVAFGWKGGIGTSSRKLIDTDGGYTVGVLVQSNFGGELTIAGVPVWKDLPDPEVAASSATPPPSTGDGSIMMVVATDAPLDAAQLQRLARRALVGLARTGSVMSNGSGDYIIAFSTAKENLRDPNINVQPARSVAGEAMSPLFQAAAEATEEAILNSLFRATTVFGHRGNAVALPLEPVLDALRLAGVVKAIPLCKADAFSYIMASHQIPGAQLVVTKEGKSVAYEYGVQNRATKQPVTQDTVFEAASLSKVIGAYIALRMVDQGKLDLDTPLWHYWPSPRIKDNPQAQKITARMVLNHTTGLPGWQISPADPAIDTTPLESNFVPGTRFAYSGEGFYLLQHTLEHIAGLGWNALAQREVFTPFDMPSSSYLTLPKFAAVNATGHEADGGVRRERVFGWENTAWTLTTNARDYDHFIQRALFKGEGLKPATHAAWIAESSNADDKDVPSTADPYVSWGLGVGRETTAAHARLWHWGDNPGFKALFMLDANTGESLVLFTNSENGLSTYVELLKQFFGEGEYPAIDWARSQS